MVTKIPENSNEILIYTVEKIKELTQKHIISKPVEPRNYCVFCRSNHNVLECKALLEKDKKEHYGCTHCYIWSDRHDLVRCKWTQVIDLAALLTDIEQQCYVYETCVHTRKNLSSFHTARSCVCLHGPHKVVLSEKWTQIFSLPNCKKEVKNSIEVKMAEEVTPNQDRVTETRNKRDENQERQMTREIPSKITSRALPINQDGRQLFFFFASLNRTCYIRFNGINRKRINERETIR